jgi:hypothetical protein
MVAQCPGYLFVYISLLAVSENVISFPKKQKESIDIHNHPSIFVSLKHVLNSMIAKDNYLPLL